MAAVALGFTACDDTSDLGMVQPSTRPVVMEANGVTVSLSPEANTGINLETAQAQAVPVLVLDEVKDLPANASVEFDMEIASNEAFDGAVTLGTTHNDNVYYVKTQDFENAMVSLYHNTPVAQKPYIRFVGYIVEGNQKALLGGEGFYYLANQINVTPVDMKLDVESAYYLGGTAGNIKMEHSDLHPYDDPNFIVMFDVTDAQAQAGFKWQIVPQSQIANPDAAKCFGPSGSETLALGGEGSITAAGKYRLSVNMLEKKYTLTFAFEVLYTPGSGNNWSQIASPCLYTTDYTNYFGVTITGNEGAESGEFKLCAFTNWDINWGLDGDKLVPGGPNIETRPAGLWWVSANLNALTISMLHIEKAGIIGLNGDWDNDINLTPSENGLKWTGTITANDNTEFKFRFNNGWDANLGGTADKLEAGGPNIGVAAGTYTVVLDMTKVPYTCTLTKK